MTTIVRVLVVGAGAVGQVFAHHLAQAGASVTLLVKPKYRAELASGLTMARLRVGHAPQRERFEGYDLVTAPHEADGQRWDQVYFTVSSAALRDGDEIAPWVSTIARVSRDATIVFLQPNLDDRALVSAVIDEARMVDGMIGFLSYQAPLPGETRFAERCMAYWFPPLSPCAFSGPEARVNAVVELLQHGALPAVRRHDITRTAPFPNAMLYAYLAALESQQWSLRALRSGHHLEHAATAAREAMAIAAHRIGADAVPWNARLANSPALVRMALRFAPAIVPLPLEPYLRVHFTKVGEQMRLGLRAYVELGDAQGLPTTALRELGERVHALPPAS